MIRSFIAVEIDSGTKKEITRVVAEFKKSEADVKWVTENQMHLTLKFLGSIDEIKIPEIQKSLNTVCANNGRFSISLDEIGAFPGLKRPKILWVGLNTGAENLKKIHAEIETCLEKTGIEKENRAYRPHLTIGRIRSFKNFSSLCGLLKKKSLSGRVIGIKRLILFRSDLNGSRAVHTKVSEHFLA